MRFDHTPVLLEPVLRWMRAEPGDIIVDGTLGGGGHSRAMLEQIQPGGKLYGIDRDDAAINAASERLSSFPGFTPIRGNFHDMKALLAEQGITEVDGILLDLGVSSPQLDDGERGFSFHQDAPLDMRMDRRQSLTAREIVNEWGEGDISLILRDYGEEKWAARIAKILVEHRSVKPLESTLDLVAVIDAAIPKRVRRAADGHPARRTFQALRIAVNDELGPLRATIEDAVSLLRPQGRLLVISFHSLEDRIVKQAFRSLQNPCTCPPKAPVCTCHRQPVVKLPTGPVKADEAELSENPRARSALLRVAEKR